MQLRAEGSRWMFAAYIALLLCAPLPFGSVTPGVRALLAFLVLILALWWIAHQLYARHSVPHILKDARLVLWCALAWLVYVWAQLVPLPLGLLKLVSPQAAHWHLGAAPSGSLSYAPLTLDPYATLEAACRSTAYISFFVLSLVLLRDRNRVRYTAYALIASGVLQGLYGALVSLQSLGEVATGTFGNRNHYAGYLTMCLSVGIGVLIANLSGTTQPTWGRMFRDLMQWAITPKMALRLGLVIMVVALVLTRSRMGNSSFFIGMLITGAIGLLLAKRATKSMVILLISLIAIDVFIVGTYFGTRKVVQSIAQTTTETEDRDEVAGYALKMWKDYPVLGAGLGSFPLVFPRYSGSGTEVAYTHAHNDYLEFAAETGALGLGLLGAIVTLSFVAALRAQYLRRDALMRGMSFAALMGIIALMIHSAVDFNLQIPANALTFMVILALAWVSLHLGRSES